MENTSNRSFLGAIASAIKAICALVVNLVSVADEATDMLSTTVKSAREKQAVDLTISMADYSSNALKLAAKRQLETKQEIDEFLRQDTTGKRSQEYQQVHDHLKSLVDSELARIRANRLAG